VVVVAAEAVGLLFPEMVVVAAVPVDLERVQVFL
jgi:hypothetical protein